MRVTKDLVAASATPMVLGILAEGESYGYAILRRINELSGGELEWTEGLLYPLLHRLQRLGHVEASWQSVTGERRRKYYRITDQGRDEVAAWFTTPVARTQPPRDELAIKLALAVTVPGVDVGTVIQRQRTATMAALQDYTRLKRAGRAASPVRPDDMAWSLVLDSLVFAAEAEIRWLDHCEARLRRAALTAENTAAFESGQPREVNR